MDKDALIALLSQANMGDPHHYRSALEALLLTHSFYKENPNPAFPIGGSIFDPRPPVMAHTILAALKTKSPAQILNELEQTFSLGKVEVHTFAYVENVFTDFEIDLGGGVVALPKSAAPTQSFANAIQQATGTLIQRPGAILKATVNAKVAKAASSPPGHPIMISGYVNPGEVAIRKAINLVTLQGPSAPQARVWTWHTSANLGILPFSEGGQSFEYPQRLPPEMPPQITDKAKKLLPLYDALPGSSRKRVDAAISRLNLGVSETAFSDRIVEAAIAIEAILSDDEKLELTYRHRLRSALLLETEYEKRRAVKKLVRSLYDERSKLVHTGIAGDADHALAKQALELAGRLIERILEIGRIPDWDTVELTGGDMSKASLSPPA